MLGIAKTRAPEVGTDRAAISCAVTGSAMNLCSRSMSWGASSSRTRLANDRARIGGLGRRPSGGIATDSVRTLDLPDSRSSSNGSGAPWSRTLTQTNSGSIRRASAYRTKLTTGGEEPQRKTEGLGEASGPGSVPGWVSRCDSRAFTTGSRAGDITRSTDALGYRLGPNGFGFPSPKRCSRLRDRGPPELTWGGRARVCWGAIERNEGDRRNAPETQDRREDPRTRVPGESDD